MRKTLLLTATLFAVTACQTRTVMPVVVEAPPILQVSQLDYAATEAGLREAITSRGFKLFTVIDHGAGAETVGKDIGQNKLFIFGNPEGGTPLMETSREFGLELPLKVLLYEADDGTVYLARRDMRDLGDDYAVTIPDKIDAALTDIIEDARGMGRP